MGFLSDIFDPGRKDREAGQALAQEGVVDRFGIQGPGGISAGFDFSEGGGDISTSLGSFAPLLEQFQGQAGFGSEQAQGRGPAAGILQDIDTNRARFDQGDDFGGLGKIFQSSLSTAQADPFDLGADISSRLRALSERRNKRQVNRFFDRLKSTGNLGSSAGIARAGDLERNQAEQGLQFDLAGLQAGQSLQKDAFGRVLGASQGRENIGRRSFGEESGLFQSFLQSQQVGSQIGAQGLAGSTGLSQLPLSFLQAAQSATTGASNTRFAAAGVNLQAGAQAKSPFLEAINAAAGVVSAFNPAPQINFNAPKPSSG